MITFHAYTKPLPWKRAGRNGKRTFTPKPMKDYKDRIGYAAKAAMKGREPITGPVKCHIVFVFSWPESWSLKKRKIPGNHWHTSTPDIDNLMKNVSDALNGICYVDDRFICDMSATKQKGLREGVHVFIEPLVW